MPALLIALLAAAAPQAAASPAPETLKTQELFDQASHAAVSNECQHALTLFAELDRRKVLKAGSIADAAASVRKGSCLIWTGKVTDGQEAIHRGLPILEKAGPEFVEDVAGAFDALGDGAMTYFDYDAAIAQYQQALSLRKGDDRMSSLVRLSKATAFDGGQAPLAYSEEALALLSAKPEKERNKDSLAALHTLHARTLLNQGKVQEGYAELKKALALSGGLTERTTLSEVSMRSDLGMAAALAGHKDDAHLYLAYTGAGRISGATFKRGESMEPPLCGEETGLRPDDIAVVEFAIREDGSAESARTIYSRGDRAAAAAFAKAVNGWYWTPDSIRNIPAFYRVSTRVEMRCSLAGDGAPSVLSPAVQRFSAWVSRELPGVQNLEQNPFQRAKQLRQQLDQNAYEGKPMARAAALAAIATLEAETPETVNANVDQALAAATEAKAPVETINWLRMLVARNSSGHAMDRKSRLALQMLAADPSFAADPLSADTALMLATVKFRGSSLPEAPALLTQVAGDGRLPEHHALRQAARLALANIAASKGDGAAAQRYFAETGLTEQQCALIGVRPSLRATGAGSEDYPTEALRMGFEGWVNLEFDITADGKAVSARPIIAYPPLVFVDAAEGMSKDFRYEASYRPAGGAACSAKRETINFIRPNG